MPEWALEEVKRVIREGFAPRHIAGIRDLGRGDPFLFYLRLGYAVTGLMPDASGPGRPDIFMSKPIRR